MTRNNEEKAEIVPQDPIATEKDAIRTLMRAKRYEIKEKERCDAAKKIATKLEGYPIDLYLRSYLICVYLSTAHELPMRYVVRKAWEMGKRVCVPAWDAASNEYLLFEFSPGMRIITGKFGIREPIERIPVFPWDVSAFILPGLAFDEKGGRLGYGGGYYDRILAKTSPATFYIGVCYDWQIQDSLLPQETHDHKMSWVVSDRRVIDCREEMGGGLFSSSPGRKGRYS